jgi:heme/copper-type cytochrome/quinol oxidase subunit 1
MSFAVGSTFPFTIGGLTGIVSANFGIDVALYDTYHVAAYSYHAFLTGAVSALFVGFYYRIGKMPGL